MSSWNKLYLHCLPRSGFVQIIPLEVKQMTDVLLMVPLPYFIKFSPIFPDLGIGYIASATRTQGFSVDVLDWSTNYNSKQFKEYLQKTSPKIIGLKIFTINLSAAIKTIQLIKEAIPDSIIIVGGPHPSTCDPDDIFKELPDINFSFRGEVEAVFPQFLDTLQSINFNKKRLAELSSKLKKIPNLLWSDERENFCTQSAFEEIAMMPLPAWDLIDPRNFKSLPGSKPGKPQYLAQIITTRGCPFSCSFCCAHHINGKSVRRRPVKDVVDEMELLNRNYNVFQIAIADSSFFLDLDYLNSFCDEILKRNLDIKWDCIYEILIDFDQNIISLLEKMSKAGCTLICLGIETACEKTMMVTKKKFRINQIKNLISAAHDVSIQVRGYFMLGFPEETIEDAKVTINFALSNHFDDITFSHLLPLPGTAIYDGLKLKYGFKKIDWVNYNPHNPPYQISQISSSVLNKNLLWANIKAIYKVNNNYVMMIKKMLLALLRFSH